MDYEIVVYTDGSCIDNGQARARAGYGVYCPDDQRLNYSRRLDGRQTNQRAEIMGARCGIMRAKEYGYQSVVVRLDSKYVKNGIEYWLPDWERNVRSDITNLQDFQALRNSMRDIEVEFEWVSRYENEEADHLARKGANYPIGVGASVVFK